jgi:hypothetical protein
MVARYFPFFLMLTFDESKKVRLPPGSLKNANPNPFGLNSYYAGKLKRFKQTC